MSQPTRTTLQCSNCGTPNPATLRRIIDVQKDPQGKIALLNGQINQFQCNNCGTLNSVSSPLLYHDATKDMLVAFVPMDVAMRQGSNEEQMVGQLMNELTASIPKEEFRSYMFNPKRALTMKGLIEQVLEADGVTPEMMAEQQERVELVQKFFEAENEESLIQLVTENDDKIDTSVFQTIALMAQRMIQTGQEQAVGHLAAIQQILVESSTFGQELAQRQVAQEQAIEDVTADLEKLDQNATRSDFIDIAIAYADDEDKLQALVGLIRPAFDPEFFTELSERAANVSVEERETLEALRDTIRELTEQVDQQTQMMVQQKAQFLQTLLNSNEYQQIMSENAQAIDDNFMHVLTSNIQESERRKDIQVSAKLRQIYEFAVSLLQSQMSPELIFINDLLSAEDDDSMQVVLDERIGNFDAELLDVVDAVEGLLTKQGQQAAVARLGDIRQALIAVLS